MVSSSFDKLRVRYLFLGFFPVLRRLFGARRI